MINEFQNKGFVIVKDLLDTKLHEELFFLFYDLSISAIKRNQIPIKNKLFDVSKLNFPRDLNRLDENLLSILKYDKDIIGELYDTVSYSSTFLKLVSNIKIEEISKTLLNLSNYNSIYSWTHRVRIDPPQDNRRTYGWHQEIFYTFPDTKFLQTWCPLIRNTTIDNGTIQVKVRSHQEGIANQTWKEIDGRATQILVDKNIVDKYETLSLPMQTGDVLFFDPHLIHRSGQNVTKDEIRFSLVGMWNDTTHIGFRAPKPKFESRTYSSKENFIKHFPNQVL